MAAELAATYGYTAVPNGLTTEQFESGLVANLPRMRAMRILEMSRAIGIVMSEQDNAEDLLAAIGQSATRAGPSGLESWRQDRRATFKEAR